MPAGTPKKRQMVPTENFCVSMNWAWSLGMVTASNFTPPSTATSRLPLWAACHTALTCLAVSSPTWCSL